MYQENTCESAPLHTFFGTQIGHHNLVKIAKEFMYITSGAAVTWCYKRVARHKYGINKTVYVQILFINL
jgi:hypothetical protein